MSILASLQNASVVDQVILSILACSSLGFLFKKKSAATFALVPQNSLSGVGAHRLCTHAWFHADLAHLLMNCLGLFVFGHALQRQLGSGASFMFIFAISVVIGAILYCLLFRQKAVSVIGVSGAVYGVIAALFFIQPGTSLGLGVPTSLFVIGFIALGIIREVWNKSGVAHGLHLTGAVAGAIGAFLLKPQIVHANLHGLFVSTVKILHWLTS